MCVSYFGLDGDNAVSQLDDFRTTHKPAAHCVAGENAMPWAKQEFELCTDNISDWHNSAMSDE